MIELVDVWSTDSIIISPPNGSCITKVPPTPPVDSPSQPNLRNPGLPVLSSPIVRKPSGNNISFALPSILINSVSVPLIATLSAISPSILLAAEFPISPVIPAYCTLAGIELSSSSKN